MLILVIISFWITLFIRSTDEGKPLRKLFAKYASKLNANGFIYKATVECLECRVLWLSIITTTILTLIYSNLFYFIGFPLVWIISIYAYKVVSE